MHILDIQLGWVKGAITSQSFYAFESYSCLSLNSVSLRPRFPFHKAINKAILVQIVAPHIIILE
jgi:hypothetical protein